jgi:hypothetical protein
MLLNLLGDSQVFKDLLERVDQTWARVKVSSPPTAAATHQYVLAVQAVSESMLDGLRVHQKVDPSVLPQPVLIVTAASLAPMVLETPRAWQAVVEVALEKASAHADQAEGLDTAGKLRSMWVREARSTPLLILDAQQNAAIAQLVSAELIDSYEPPLDTVERVFVPRGGDELGSWLGVSRTTVSDWRTERFAPSAEHERRLETVAAIARLVDQYIHPEDQQLYLRSTMLPAFQEQTLDKVLTTTGDDAERTLNRVLVLLRAALVQ